jgi:threonine dehydrogenase-like Zn-dependent dehydrogenase
MSFGPRCSLRHGPRQADGTHQMDRPTVLRQAIMTCKKGGTVSVQGVYAGLIDISCRWRVHEQGSDDEDRADAHDALHEGSAGSRARREIDPSSVISHKLPIDKAREGYRISATSRTVASR